MKDWLKSLIIPVLAAITVTSFSQAAVWNWSQTAANNATADPTINWSVGMSPSSVSPSGRAMMAAVAKYRDDISGLIATGGTSTAYTATSNSSLAATPTNGQLIAVTMHTTNGASPTLAVDGGTAFPIQTAAGTAVGAATLVQGSPYSLKFNSATSSWVLRNFYGSPFVVPLGGIVIHSAAAVPNSNFAFANGQCISRTTYAAYFALVSTAYGTCDGSTTFGVPDLMESLVGFTAMGGASPSRITLAASGCNPIFTARCGAQTTTIGQANLPNVNFNLTVNVSDPGHTHGAPAGAFALLGAAGATWATPAGGPQSQAVATASATTGITASGTAASGGSDTPIVRLPPVLFLTALVRIF